MEKNGHTYPPEEESFEEEFSLSDEIDHEILMHRDAHFGGDFDVMLHYYQQEGIGINPDIDIDRINYLKQVEQELEQNLAAAILSPVEIEKIATCRRAYEQLKEVYDLNPPPVIPKLLADLILSEDEEPFEEIEAIVQEGDKMIDELIQITQSLDAYDALFPGYGFAPYLAVVCLQKLQTPKALIPIFEMFNRDAVFDEEVLIDAFYEIGAPAKNFLLKILKSRPLTNDNVNAAFALSAFSTDFDVATAAFEQLQDPDVQSKPLLTTYLLCHCDALKASEHAPQFEELSQSIEIPDEMRKQMKTIVADWKQ